MLHQLQDLLEKLDIKKILLIDDEAKKISDAEKTYEELKGLLDVPENRNKILEGLEEEEYLKEIVDFNQLDKLDSDEENRIRLVSIALGVFPLLKSDSTIEKIKNNLLGIFNLEIDIADRPNEVDESLYDLIFVDYDFNGQFYALDFIHKFKRKEDKIQYIVLLSSKEQIEYEENDYIMERSEMKQDLFRKYLSNQNLEFKALLNYINKKDILDQSQAEYSVLQMLIEMKSGKLMSESLTSIKGLLNNGIEEAFKKLYLTNSKTLKLLMSNKLENEGISETQFLVDLSYSLVKNLINKQSGDMESIHKKLEKIQSFEAEFWDYETDEQLKEIRDLQLFDRAVSDRYSPIDFGDVFEIEIGPGDIRKGILLSQSCDLIIRWMSDGRIGRNEKAGLLIMSDKKTSGQFSYSLNLGIEKIKWDVRNILMVPLDILDLTSLNEDGNAEISLNQVIERKYSWGNLYNEYIKNNIKDITELCNGIEEDYEEYYLKHGIYNKFKYNHSSKKIKFSIKRIGRLDFDTTKHILNIYTNLKNRVALPLDISENNLIESAKFNINNVSTKFKLKIESITKVGGEKEAIYYLNFETLIQELTKRNYIIPSDFKEIYNSIFDIEQFKVLQSEGKRLLVLSEENLLKLGNIGIKIDVSNQQITCFFLEKILIAGNEYVNGTDLIIKYNDSLQMVEMLVKKEHISNEELKDLINEEGYFDIYCLGIESFVFSGNKMSVDITNIKVASK